MPFSTVLVVADQIRITDLLPEAHCQPSDRCWIEPGDRIPGLHSTLHWQVWFDLSLHALLCFGPLTLQHLADYGLRCTPQLCLRQTPEHHHPCLAHQHGTSSFRMCSSVQLIPSSPTAFLHLLIYVQPLTPHELDPHCLITAAAACMPISQALPTDLLLLQHRRQVPLHM